MNDFQPTWFGKYQLIKRIAVGGMAELFLARMTGAEGFEKLIAIKKILPHLEEEEDLVKFFIDEAKLAALLSHQNIVQIYDFGTLEGSYFIAMEYLQGRDLHVVSKKNKEKDQPISIENALYISQQICAGLDYAHNLKDLEGKPLHIIHRDVSPPNIIITYEGDVKIVDFGIAKAAGSTSKTSAGNIKGKAAYMSPEQAKGERIDHRADVFASGFLLYEMIMGRRMFEGNTFEVLKKVRNVEYEPPEKIFKGLPPRICRIIHRALEKDIEKRYQSCGEMRAEIDKCIQQLSFHPSNSGLAQYMRELFDQDIAAEEKTFREAAKVEISTEPEADKAIPKTKKEEKTTLVVDEDKKAIKGRAKGLWLAGVVALLALLIVVFIFSFKDEEGSKPKKEAAIPAAHKATTESMEKKTSSFTGEKQKAGSPEPDLTKVNLAIAALKKERFGEAVALFREVLKAKPALIGKLSSPYSKALRSHASELMKTDLGKAKALLLKAVEIEPTSVESHFQLGLLYVRQKNYPKAIETYKKAAELDPKFPDTFFNLGYVYAMTKNYAKAEEMYGRVVKLKPPFLDEALFNMAIVQDKLGKRAKCIKSLKRAIEVNPQNKPAKNFLKRLKGKSGGKT